MVALVTQYSGISVLWSPSPRPTMKPLCQSVAANRGPRRPYSATLAACPLDERLFHCTRADLLFTAVHLPTPLLPPQSNRLSLMHSSPHTALLSLPLFH